MGQCQLYARGSRAEKCEGRWSQVKELLRKRLVQTLRNHVVFSS